MVKLLPAKTLPKDNAPAVPKVRIAARTSDTALFNLFIKILILLSPGCYYSTTITALLNILPSDLSCALTATVSPLFALSETR